MKKTIPEENKPKSSVEAPIEIQTERLIDLRVFDSETDADCKKIYSSILELMKEYGPAEEKRRTLWEQSKFSFIEQQIQRLAKESTSREALWFKLNHLKNLLHLILIIENPSVEGYVRADEISFLFSNMNKDDSPTFPTENAKIEALTTLAPIYDYDEDLSDKPYQTILSFLIQKNRTPTLHIINGLSAKNKLEAMTRPLMDGPHKGKHALWLLVESLAERPDDKGLTFLIKQVKPLEKGFLCPFINAGHTLHGKNIFEVSIIQNKFKPLKVIYLATGFPLSKEVNIEHWATEYQKVLSGELEPRHSIKLMNPDEIHQVNIFDDGEWVGSGLLSFNNNTSTLDTTQPSSSSSTSSIASSSTEGSHQSGSSSTSSNSGSGRAKRRKTTSTGESNQSGSDVISSLLTYSITASTQSFSAQSSSSSSPSPGSGKTT